MEIGVRNLIMNKKESNIKANVDLLFDNSLVVKGYSICQGKDGYFIGEPSQKGTDGNYYKQAFALETDLTREISSIVMSTYENCLAKNQNLIKGEYVDPQLAKEPSKELAQDLSM